MGVRTLCVNTNGYKGNTRYLTRRWPNRKRASQRIQETLNVSTVALCRLNSMEDRLFSGTKDGNSSEIQRYESKEAGSFWTWYEMNRTRNHVFHLRASIAVASTIGTTATRAERTQQLMNRREVRCRPSLSCPILVARTQHVIRLCTATVVVYCRVTAHNAKEIHVVPRNRVTALSRSRTIYVCSFIP